MRTLTIRLPKALLAELEAEARRLKLSKSAVVRRRLTLQPQSHPRASIPLHDIADLIGSIDGLPSDLSAGKKKYLRLTGYGGKRAR